MSSSNFEKFPLESDSQITPLLAPQLPAQVRRNGFLEAYLIQNAVAQLAVQRTDFICQVVDLTADALNGLLGGHIRSLTDFAYVVSHDLKAPLRGISTVAEWLANDGGEQLGEDGRNRVNLIADRAARMRDLIDGILQYSRLGHTEETRHTVDFNTLVPEVIGDLAIPDHVSVTIAPDLPTLTVEPTRIRQVFQNLLSHALKYLDKPQGRIRVACKLKDGAWVFSVTDNGVGIEAKHFERIFQIFQTLSPGQGFDNTGVGLTVAKKIVESHGGVIWIESEVGRGSTFLFTLPQDNTEVFNAGIETDTTA